MRYEDKEIHDIGELIQFLRADIGDYTGPVWYRGQSLSEWRLEPKLLRGGAAAVSESHFINRFKQNAAFLLQKAPLDEFDWLFLMQHYGMQTRLLDWSEGPLVGLYFAVQDAEHLNQHGALWALMPTKLNSKSNYRPAYEHEVPSFDDEHLRNYQPGTIAREQRSSLYPMAAIARRNSARMQAQQGVFTISHRFNTVIEEVGEEGALRDHVWRYVVPSGAKGQIKRDLKLLGFTKFNLFPELESISTIV
jgi:hypothetical protein